MSDMKAKIEAMLFLSTKPMSFSRLGKLLNIKFVELKKMLDEMAGEINNGNHGVHLIMTDDSVTLATNPDLSQELTELTKDDLESELTRPQLETLTIIAYRAPITKPEIEHIRGVNCSIILRNLLMRGLIEEREDDVKLQNVYVISSKMLRHLGIHSIAELPDFDELHNNAKIDQLLSSLTDSSEE